MNMSSSTRAFRTALTRSYNRRKRDNKTNETAACLTTVAGAAVLLAVQGKRWERTEISTARRRTQKQRRQQQQENHDPSPLLDRILRSASFSLAFGLPHVSTTACDDLNALHEFDKEHPDGYTEAERFFQSLEYHRALLFDYTRRWEEDDGAEVSELLWPRHIPDASLVPALEMDWMFCTASPNYRDNRRVCHDLQFKIAAYYLMNGKTDAEQKNKGYKLIKDLADHGHADGMCLYGKCERDVMVSICVLKWLQGSSLLLI